MKSTKSITTSDHILDVAERHFAVFGFAGTSLRGIIKEADVNVAAVAYHFGTKEDLFSAVIQRFAVPVVEEQLRFLDVALRRKNVKLEDVLRSFYEPPLRIVKKLGKKGEALSQFLGRAQTEAEPIYSLVDQHYAACREQFIAALRRVLPGLSESRYQWYFEFMLSLIVCFLTRHKPIRRRFGATDDWDPDEILAELISFCQAGMRTGGGGKHA